MSTPNSVTVGPAADSQCATSVDANTILTFEEVTIRLGKGAHPLTLVEGISVRIKAGECAALVGESGSGKSLTSLAAMRLLPDNMSISGHIWLRGRDGVMRDVLEMSNRAMTKVRGMEIGMIFQEPMTSLNPLLSVGDQIAEMFMVHRGEGQQEAMDHAEEMLQRVGISEARTRLSSMPHEMSGGMRQRVMIAIAIACDPSIVIADEPTTALDVTIQAQILDTLRELQGQKRGMLFVSHDLGVIAEVADTIHVMYAGQVVESGSVSNILLNARHPYSRGLVESVPRIDRPQAHGADLYSIPGRVPEVARMPTGCRFHPRCSYALAGICNIQIPVLETLHDGSQIRCHRWSEIASAQVDGIQIRGNA